MAPLPSRMFRIKRTSPHDRAAEPHGCERHVDEKCAWKWTPPAFREYVARTIIKTMRASILVLRPLLAAIRKGRSSLPAAAHRRAPVNLHVAGLEKMGAEIHIENGYIRASAGRLKGARIVFDIVTVTGTENLMMAATLADGETVLENAAREPEVVDLAEFLIAMGAKIHGAGTDRITIQGVEKLKSRERVKHRAARSMSGTYLVAGAITAGKFVSKTSPNHLDAVIGKLQSAGATVATGADWIDLE